LRTIQNADPSFINAVKKTPLEYLLTETDSNKPEGVLTVCKIIGEIKEISLEDVGKITTQNLMRLCNL
jgi:Tat protein secretion system quality control protein TatD with DNase activity